jgi:hypothetical protein
MSDIEYGREQDRLEYRLYRDSLIARFGRLVPDELWHYTTADGLIGILKSGHIWSTQVACLNDTLEQLYFGNLVHDAVKIRRAQNTNTDLEPLYRMADLGLATREFSAHGQFVACFSEV